MSKLHQRQIKISIMWGGVTVCAAAVATIEAFELQWWLVAGGMIATGIGAIGGMYFAHRTLVATRELHQLQMTPWRR